ncbi:anti-sigma factor [Permianibacter aggregans]|uniref:Uncharacterized protein n=1 Tax=Permianibacter aggregans TaxID=1510150 RepID=A0A4R6V1I8_9GAMM|nr:anti-sigma factor [Permianibacter aggregans]QGX39352.1 anti-sigma factor [Permianibacter aggregans]TDQ49914.1 hypothetical protein EV696_103289 [Permianibacter aggregans]
MLSCKNIAEHAGDIHDRQLPLSRRLAVRLHLMLCNACRRFLKQYALAATTGAKAMERRQTEGDAEQVLRRID